MARYIITTGSEDGHVTPCLPIVRILIERSHQVVWLTGRKYEDRITAIGAKFHPLPIQTDSSMTDMYVFHPGLGNLSGLAQIKYYIKHIFLDACEIEIEVLQTILADFPADVLVGDTITFYTYFQSEISGVPSAMISLLPLSIPDKKVAPYGLGLTPRDNFAVTMRNQLLNFLINQIMLRDVNQYANATRRKLGLPPLKEPFIVAMSKIPNLIMHVSTPAFEYPRSNLPENVQFIGPIMKARDTSFNEPAWWNDLESTKPIILVNQGTIAMDLNDLIIPTIKALERESMLVIAVPVKQGQIQEIPPNVRAEAYIPFEHLLPYVDVMITNGGYGGTQMALAHGIPLIVAGQTDDKMEVAARVEWSGAGINLKKQRPLPEDISDAVSKILSDPAYRQNAKRIQLDFANYDAPNLAVELLETLARDQSR